MNCEELLSAMNEYVDGRLEPGICRDFEQHLAGCNPCQVVIDNIRQTITLYREGRPFSMPVDFSNRLREVLRDRWAARPGGKPDGPEA